MAKKPGPQNNVDFVKTLMSSYKVGPLAQIVVVCAIETQIRQWLSLTPKELQKRITFMFAEPSWREACVEIHQKIINRVDE